MKATYLLFSLALAAAFSSCKKECEKDPVETPAACTTWNKLLGGTLTDAANASAPTPDGGYIVVGSTQSNDGDITGNHGNIDLLVFKVDKAGNRIWQKSFGGTNLDIANSVTAAEDGGYIIAGYTLSANGDVVGSHGNEDAWILKIDEQGNKLWQKTWGGSRGDIAFATASASDGYIIAIGTASTDGDLPATNESANTWLVKIGTNGDIIWQKSIGVDFFHDIPSKLIATTDGYVVAGSSGDGTLANARVVKTTITGDIIWQKTFGGRDQDEFTGISEGINGGYILTGFTASDDGDIAGNTRGDYDVLVVKIDANGNTEWLKTFGGSHVDGISGTSVVKTISGHYIIVASALSNDGDLSSNHGETDAWVLKLNASGNKESQQVLGGAKNDHVRNLIKASDCGYVLFGWSFSNDGEFAGNHSTGFADVWIRKINDL